MFVQKYPHLTLLASLILILLSIWPLLHNIAYFNGGNLLGIIGILIGSLGITLVESDHGSHTEEK